MDAVQLVHTDRKYDGSELATAILAVALLDAERRGAVRLQVEKVGRLFGLRKVDAVTLTPGPEDAGLLAGTFEARIRQAVAARGKPMEAKDAFVAALVEDAGDPHAWAVSLVARGLAERGLLETQETKRLKVFRTQVHVMPEATGKLLAQTRGEEVRSLLEGARQGRPDVWPLLQKALKDAFSARTEQGDDGPDFD